MQRLPPELIDQIVLYTATTSFGSININIVETLYRSSSIFAVLSTPTLFKMVDRIDLREDRNLESYRAIFKAHPALLFRYCKRVEDNHKTFVKKVNIMMHPSNPNTAVSYVCESCEWFHEVPKYGFAEDINMVYCGTCRRHLCTDCAHTYYEHMMCSRCYNKISPLPQLQ